jgi:hypothetical protein
MSYRVGAISEEVSNEVRRNMASPFGNLPAWSSAAHGYGPCRSCLKTFRQGEEERIYITYNPFHEISDLPLPGPVFIHTEPCKEHSTGDLPPHLLEIPMLLEGFGEHSRLVRSVPVNAERVDEQIESLLGVEDVEFIHIRNAEAGCFIAKIERAE